MVRHACVALAVLLGVLTAPVAANRPPTPPAPAVAPPPGTRLAPVADAAGWVRSVQDAAARAGTPARVLHADTTPSAIFGEEHDHRRLYLTRDFDGDRVADVLLYRSVYSAGPTYEDGYTEFTSYSGRTGARRWHRRIEDIALPEPIFVRVGPAGGDGIALLDATVVRQRANLLDPLSLLFPKEERRLRIVGITNRGKVAYDKTLTTADGRGDIQFGGTFQAYPGGGDELLFGRVQPLAPGLLAARPYTLDGYNGAVRPAHREAIAVAQELAYVAIGDVDKDRRAEFVEVRHLANDLGSVTAHSVFEERTLWTAEPVTVSPYVWSGGTADMTGNGDRDVLLNMFTMRASVTVAGLPPDDLPLLPEYGVRGLLLDGETGALRWDRLVSWQGYFESWADIDRDGKRDVMSVDVFEDEADRDGVRIIPLTGAGAELYRRDVTVSSGAGDPTRSVYGFAYPAGDLDADGLEDAAYYVATIALDGERGAAGLLLVRRNHAVATPDFPFLGTLDGGTDERVTESWTRTTATFTVRDGYRGPAYWTVRGTAEVPDRTKSAVWSLAALPGARGRCDGALLVGAAPGALWLDALDGGTGRVRWSRTFKGNRPDTTVRASGRRASCR